MKNSRSFHAKSISKIRLNSESSVEDIIGQLNNNACSISNIAHGLRIISEKLSSKSLSNQLDTQYRAIKDKIEDELDALDSHGIIDLCCWMKNQNIILSMNARMKLDRLLTDLILKGNLENKHIIEIYHYLKPLGYSITELESTVDRLVQEPEIDLSLNEIWLLLSAGGKRVSSKSRTMFTNLMEKSAKMKPEEVDHRSVSKILNYLSKEEISHFKQYFRQFLSILKSKSTGLDENCLLIILKADIQNRDEDAKAGSILEKLSRILLQKQDLSITFLKELIDHFKLHNDRNSKRIEELAYDKAIQKANNTYLSSSEIIELFHILRKTLDLKTANCIKDSIRKNSFTHLESFDLVNMISKIMVADAGYLKRFSSIIPDSFLIKLDRKEVQELSVSEIIKILNRIYTTQNYQSLASYTELLKEKLISDLLLPSLMQEFIDLLTYFELPEIVLEEIKYVQPLVYEFLTINKPYNLLSIATKLRYCDLEHWEQFVEMNFQSFSDEDILDFTQKCDSISAINWLLSNYEELNAEWIRITISNKHIAKASKKELSDFLRFLNLIDPKEFLYSAFRYITPEFYWQLLRHDDLTPLQDLLVETVKLMPKLSSAALLSESNMKLIWLLSEANTLNSELADKLIRDFKLGGYQNAQMLLMIASRTSDSFNKEEYLSNLLSTKMPISSLSNTLEKYLRWPVTENYEKIVIKFAEECIKGTKTQDIFFLISALIRLSKIEKNNHRQLMKAICIAAEKEIKANINKVRLNEIINLTNFATTSYTKEIDIIPLIRSHLLNGPVYTTDFRDALIRKLVEVGITDVEIMKRMFNIRQKVTSKYIYEAVTALADLRFENEIWALDFVRDLVNMAQKNEIIYDDETQVLNLIWSLTRFKIKDQFFDRMMTNFSNIDNKNLSFKRILLAHHSGTDSNLFNLEGMNDFDWTQKFGIGRNFLNPFKKLLDKNNYDNLDNQVINDLWVPLYVPVNKTVIWPISKAACLYKSNRLRGEFETYKEIVEKKVGKLVIVSNEMVSNFDESKTLNLLARSGFKNNHS